MKYRMHIDIITTSKDDCDFLWATLKNFIQKETVVSLNKDKVNEEKSLISRHECLHDDNLPCQKLEIIEK